MTVKHKNKLIYAVLSLNTFSIDIFTTKSMAAEKAQCNRNTITDDKQRIVIGDYIIFPTKLTKCNTGRR